MKTSYQWQGIKVVVGMVALCGFAISAQSTVLIDETFDTGYNRTVNNIGTTGTGNMAVYKSRNADTAVVTLGPGGSGSLSFSISANSGADAYRAYFTDVGANILNVGDASQVLNGHLLLGMGDTLISSVTFYYGTVPSDTSTAAIRFGLFDDVAGRSANDLNGGASTTMFTNNPGYGAFVTLMSVSTNNGMNFMRRTNMTTTGIFGTTADFTQIDGAVGGTSIAQSGLQLLTYKVSVTHMDANTTILTAGLYDTLTSQLLEGGSVADFSGQQVSDFSYLVWRTPRGPDAAGNGPYVFTDMKIEVIPEPSTLMLTGAGLALAIAAIRRRRS